MIPTPSVRPHRLGRLAIPVLAGALLLAGCSSDGSDGGDDPATTTEVAAAPGTGKVLDALAADVIVPAYRALADDLAALAEGASNLCAAPSAAAVTELQGTWRGAVAQWQATRPAAVGPAADQRLMSAVGFEARPKNIDKLIAGTDPVDVAGLEGEGASVRGIYAVEHVLFGEASGSLAGADGARACTYLASATTLVADAADAVAVAWEDGYADEFAAGIDGEQQMSVAELVNEINHRIQELDEKGLRDLAAAESLGDLKAGRLDGEGAFAMAGRRALLDGVAALLGTEDVGIVALVAARSPETAADLEASVEQAVTAVGELPDAMAEAFTDQPAVQAASDAVAALKVLVSTQVAAQLGVTINFSDADGDS